MRKIRANSFDELKTVAALREADEEVFALPSGLDEVDERQDSANTIRLLRADASRFVVQVAPQDPDFPPFHFEVDRATAKEAYLHPYAYYLGPLAVAS